MTAAAPSGPTPALALADWRRRVGELYAAVRTTAAADPAAAWALWRMERERLYRGHSQSPVPAAARRGFILRTWPYEPGFRFEVPVAPAPDLADGRPLGIPASVGEAPAYRRIGRLELPLEPGPRSLDLFWLDDYAGGLFLPFRDATSGGESYAGGRYLLDTAKGADLGGDPTAATVVVDLNFAFHPSCAFDPRWSCPLAPPSNRLGARIEAGERLR